MTIGALLVLLGLILAVVALFGGFVGNRIGGYVGTILAVAVVLVALGVLLGGTKLIST